MNTPMKHQLFATLLLVLTVLAGCRREDIREMTLELPTLTRADQPKIVRLLAPRCGIDTSSFRFDFSKRTLTLRYDSMQIAQANIRYLIDESGIKVRFPAKTDNHAGH